MVGKTWSSDEHLVATETGKVVRARSVRRMPEESSWSADILCGISGQPWGPTGTITYDEGIESFQVPEVQPVENSDASAPKRMKIQQRYLEKVSMWMISCALA